LITAGALPRLTILTFAVVVVFTGVAGNRIVPPSSTDCTLPLDGKTYAIRKSAVPPLTVKVFGVTAETTPLASVSKYEKTSWLLSC
jgi:hypothetical protein